LSALSPYDETNLASLLASGDETAFSHIYKKYWNKIYSISLTYLKSVQLAEDAVQEVFLKLWAKREQVAKVQNLEAFIFIIARNHLIDALKKTTGDLAFRPNDWLPDDLLLPPDQLSLKILQKKIADAIEKLPPQQKNVIKMSRELGLTHEQIAAKLGINKKTVKNHIVRALSALRLLLHEEALLLLLFLYSRL
jgi:RNA polymerase sigma-70 factor (ECF subfamily)